MRSRRTVPGKDAPDRTTDHPKAQRPLVFWVRPTESRTIVSVLAMIRCMGEGEERTWTAQEAAEEWGVTANRVRQWIREGRIRAYERAGMWFVPKDQERPPDLRLRHHRS